MSDLARNYVKQLPRSRVSPAQKKFLFFVADYHDVRTGCAWPGLDTIAEDIGITTRQVRNLLGECRELGVIDWIPGLGSGNLGRFVFRDLRARNEEGKGETKEEIKAEGSFPFFQAKEEGKEEIGYRAIRKEPGTNNTNPPNPLFAKGGTEGTELALTERQISRLRRAIQRVLREFERSASAHEGSARGLTWKDAVLQACNEELLPFASAWPAALALWDANTQASVEGCKKAPEKVSA